MKLTWQERYELVAVRKAPEDYEFDPDIIDHFEKKGLVSVLRCADGNYCSITPAGRQALKGGE